MKPMLANPLAIEDIERKARGYWMEPKLDGIRCLAHQTSDGVHMFSRSNKTQLDQIVPNLAWELHHLLRLLPLSVYLDGELGYVSKLADSDWPILDFNKTVRVTGSSVAEARRKQRENTDKREIEYYIFDMFDPANPEMSQAERRWALNTAYREAANGLIWTSLVPDADKWDEKAYDSYVLAGGEGVILKNPSADYVPDKRPAKRWYKIKKFDTFDGMIIDYDPGRGKYEGQIGALVVHHPQGFDVRCSGMTDEVRLHMTDYFNTHYLGQYVEVKYFGLTAGTPRHPQFLRMRPDLGL